MKTDFKESRAMAANIEFIARFHHLNRQKLAAVMGISESVLFNRIKDPETFRLEELERLTVWSTRHGYAVSLAQICQPFIPAKVAAAEVPA